MRPVVATAEIKLLCGCYCRISVRPVFATAEIVSCGCYCRICSGLVVATAEIMLLCGCYCRICVRPVVATTEFVFVLWLLMQNLCVACS